MGWDTTNPEFGRWVLNDVRSPITSARDYEGELVPLGFGDGGEGVPFLEGSVSDANGRAGARASYGNANQCGPVLTGGGETYYS